MKIRKAVIAAAGYGTRRLPVTKAIQKELLPYLNKPMIDYIVDACLEAGIEEFIFVVKANSNQISEYYSQNLELEEYLERRGKNEELALVRNLYNKAKYTFVPQNQVDGYGTGVPLRLAQSHLENEDAFLYMGGDDIIIRNDGVSFIKLLVDEFEESGADGAATFIRRPWDSLYKYGVAKYREEEGKQILEDLIEKPEKGKEPSDLANISKYIFTPKVFKILETQKVSERLGELLITDTITEYMREHIVILHETEGDYLDGGSIVGWLKQNIKLGLNDPEISEELREEIVQLLKTD